MFIDYNVPRAFVLNSSQTPINYWKRVYGRAVVDDIDIICLRHETFSIIALTVLIEY